MTKELEVKVTWNLVLVGNNEAYFFASPFNTVDIMLHGQC